jgi:hypothetical protein
VSLKRSLAGVGKCVVSPVTATVSMQIDMTLATSYKPVLVCIGKVCMLLLFHYSSASILYVTERYAIILAVLYIDHWLAYEYIVNTNSFTAVLAVSLLVHELRDAGVQERIHGELAHTIVLSILMVCNTLVLMCGEKQSFLHLLIPSATTPQPTTDGISTKKTDRPHLPQPNPVQCYSGGGALMYILLTCILLVLLSTCAMPVSAHDPVLTHLRIWSFTILSMTWLYTVDYKQLRYSSVAPFTPCVLRFSCILFLTPTPFAIGGSALMGLCLAATYSWQHRPRYEIPTIQPTGEEVGTPQLNPVERCGRVVREASPGCVVTYRNPMVLPGKHESLPNAVASGIGMSTNVVGEIGSVVDTADYDSTTIDMADTGDLRPNPSMDYNSLFEQVLSQQVV